MQSLFENKDIESYMEWYEIEQVCIQCGAHFMADYKYNSTCFSCRFKIEHTKDEHESKDS